MGGGTGEIEGKTAPGAQQKRLAGQLERGEIMTLMGMLERRYNMLASQATIDDDVQALRRRLKIIMEKLEKVLRRVERMD
jgi:hypothetical protein